MKNHLFNKQQEIVYKKIESPLTNEGRSMKVLKRQKVLLIL